ncbi:MAG: hypothetical protein WD690_09460 [Vicinamibacterales bacterium]
MRNTLALDHRVTLFLPLALVATSAAVGSLCFAADVHASVTSIVAHGVTFSRTDTIPVFVDANVENSIVVKGQFMDLATGVESSDPSFSVRTGRRIHGSNSSIYILVGAASAPDQDGATIHVKFLVGEETFRIKAFKTRVNKIGFGIHFVAGGRPTCRVGDTISVTAQGDGATNLIMGTAGTMLDVANDRYQYLDKIATTVGSASRFVLRCTAVGSFTVDRTWFKDSRVRGRAADAMVRGAGTLAVTVVARDER